MKLLLTTEELQDAINKGLGTQLLVGNRRVTSIDIPGKYSSRQDVVIEFDDESTAIAAPEPLPAAPAPAVALKDEESF